jgi:hypothetical protein
MSGSLPGCGMTRSAKGMKPSPGWRQDVLLLGILVLAWAAAMPSSARADAQNGAAPAAEAADGFGGSSGPEARRARTR